MIRKADLVDAINCLSHDLTNLSIKVSDLRREVNDLRSEKVKVNIKSAGDKKCAKKCTQPRDKSGKFTKKK